MMDNACAGLGSGPGRAGVAQSMGRAGPAGRHRANTKENERGGAARRN